MNEYISKQKVLDYLNGYLHSLGDGGADTLLFDRGQRRALTNSIQDILAVKAADVQPVKRGRWLHIRGCWWQCSNFEDNLIYATSDRGRTEKHRYCSKCGARMDGVRNEK